MVVKCCFPVGALKLLRGKVREYSNLTEEMSLNMGHVPELPTRIIRAVGGVPLAIE